MVVVFLFALLGLTCFPPRVAGSQPRCRNGKYHCRDQDLTRHEVGSQSDKAAGTSQELSRSVESLSTAWRDGEVRATLRKEATGPRPWRTRADTFEDIWPLVEHWLNEQPDATAKALFQRLQTHAPRPFAPGQLRTLQRRVKESRTALARKLVLGASDVVEVLTGGSKRGPCDWPLSRSRSALERGCRQNARHDAGSICGRVPSPVSSGEACAHCAVRRPCWRASRRIRWRPSLLEFRQLLPRRAPRSAEMTGKRAIAGAWWLSVLGDDTLLEA